MSFPTFNIRDKFYALSKRIAENAYPALILKDLFEEVRVSPGGTFVAFREKLDAPVVGVSQTSEGATTVVDFSQLETLTYDPPEYKVKVEFSRREWMDYLPLIPEVERQLRHLGRRLAYQLEKDAMAAIDAAANLSVVSTGKSRMTDGTEVTYAGELGQYDILAAMKELRKKNLEPDYLLVNPINAESLFKWPHFTEARIYGEEVNRTGVIGTVYGLEVRQSTVVPAGTAYVVSSGRNLSGSDSFMGYWVIKEDIWSKADVDWDRDVLWIKAYTRQGALVVNGNAICKITGLSTT